MSAAKRGEELHPPSPWKVIAVDRQAAQGWARLAAQTSGNLRKAWFAITEDPRGGTNPSRRHRLKGRLKDVNIKGSVVEQWRYEVTGGGRIWYAVDDDTRTLWITWAGTGHPKATDR